MSSLPELVVRLKRGRSKPVWIGHPWVFSGAIDSVQGPIGDTGGACIVEDERGNALGTGFYNPHGRISVRLWHHRRSTDLPFEPRALTDIARERLPAALDLRAALGLPSEDTTAFRLLNSEGDGLSGLIVDRLGPALVCGLHTRAAYEAREEIASLLLEATDAETVILRVGAEASKLEAIPTLVELRGSPLEGDHVEVEERGIRYHIDPRGGQKTGFYADQREHRQRFASLAAGRRVLDLYSYAGGFGITAAVAGAEHVTSVDASEAACTAARKNAALNGVADRMNVVEADAMSFMKEARARGERWPLVVCDPPKLARGRAHLKDALKKYTRINSLAMGLLEPGGLLLTCSCSQHVSEGDFLRVLTEAGHRLRRSVQVLELGGQPGDHPFLSVAPEGRYLTVALVALA